MCSAVQRYPCAWIVISLTVVAFCAGHDNFYFSRQPVSATVVASASVTLECMATGTEHINIYWQLNGRTLANTTRRHQIGTNLHITRVDKERDLGDFTCIAMNVETGFSLTSLAASLNILWIGESASVELQTPESPSLINEDTDVVLRCKVDGSGDIHYDWFRNGEKLVKSERISFRNKRIHLSAVTADDNGVYSCRTRNDAGQADSDSNFALVVPSDQVPQIKHLPRDVLARKGDPARFDCAYHNADVVEWYFENEGPLTNSTRLTILPNNSLSIQRVHPDNEGLYKCLGISGHFKQVPVQTYVARLRLAYIYDLTADSFEPNLPANRRHFVPINSEFQITCKRPRSHPPPKVWWEDPRGRIVSDSGAIRVDGTRLVVESVKVDDAGNYSCIAENIAGVKSALVEIIVTTPPVVTLDPINTWVDEDDAASFMCDYKGMMYPVTKIGWFKDGTQIRDDKWHRFVFENNGTLIVSSVQMNDKGKYSCEVKTDGFSPVYSKSATLYVKEKLKFVPHPVDRKLELGMKEKIHCKAQGSSAPVVRWMKEGILFNWPSHIQDINGTLYFENVTASDKGRYTCVATSSQGIINATIKVDVIVSPKFKVVPKNPTEAYDGYSVMIHCAAYGDPPPTIQWDKNTVPNGFDHSRFHVMENGSLLVSPVLMEDDGKYGCIAGNSGGLKREEIQLIVRSADSYVPGNSLEELQDANMMTKTVTITLSAAASYMVLVIGLMVWCRVRQLRRKQPYAANGGLEGANALLNKTENGDIQDNTEMKDNAGLGYKDYKDSMKSDGDAAQSHSSGSHSHSSKRSRSSYDKLLFSRSDLQTIMLLGKCEMGDVFLAKAREIRSSEPDSIVMVKSLQVQNDDSVLLEFKRELDMYHKLHHDGIARLLGLCRDAEPHYMIIEYSDWGDLKQFLLATRKDHQRKGNARPPPLNKAQMLHMVNQIAQAMDYMAHHRFVHKDLATRNCLITSSLDIKIASPCLSRDTYSKEYCKYHNRIIPLRWLPAEAVFEDDYSTKSDVWAFACLVWEIYHQADFPFSDFSDELVMRSLRSKELAWEPPSQAPDLLRELLVTCWADSPSGRPTFSEVTMLVGQLLITSNV